MPLVAGKLQAFAQRSSAIREHYEFRPYHFRIDQPATIVAAHESPDVAAFSAAIWNEQLCLEVAAKVKVRYPKCLILFGGTQVPHDASGYMACHEFIDVCVRGEGEEPFKAILERYLHSASFDEIPNVTWRGDEGIRANEGAFTQPRDLDIYPSPYLNGLYDDLLATNRQTRFQAIIETNRGCPFLCTFCYWGKGGLSRKYRYFSLERVKSELDWIGKREIAFVYNADSNFGMHKRDEAIAAAMVETKKLYGFPEKVVNLYGKNTNDRIFEIGKLLADHGMHKGMGLSRQSMSAPVLENIRRSNIRLDVYQELQERFEQADVSVFSELIIGLPGETYESFGEGIEQLLQTSFSCSLLIALCEIYPNTEMSEAAYLEQHGIQTRVNRSVGVHSKRQQADWTTELISYVVGTNTMPTCDWRKTCRMSFTTMALTGMRLAFHFMLYLRERHGTRHIDFIRFLSEGQCDQKLSPLWAAELSHYDRFLDQILEGQGRAVLCPDFGEIYWAIEEATFLRLTSVAEQFFSELHRMGEAFLQSRGLHFDPDEVRQAVAFDELCTATPTSRAMTERTFSFNFPEFFRALVKGESATLERQAQRARVSGQDYGGDRWRFAQERLLWARRGGKWAAEFTWYDTATGRGRQLPVVQVAEAAVPVR